jgi:hypothetical protein
MATARAMIERRRSSRIQMRISVRIFMEGARADSPGTPAEAIAISHNGALLRAAISPALGSRIHIQNNQSQETREFRVIRVGKSKSDGSFEVGVEMLYPARNFWGIPLTDGSLKA